MRQMISSWTILQKQKVLIENVRMIQHLPAFTPPPGYNRIKIVGSFEELVSTPLRNGVNALCWLRELAGDFREIVERLGVGEGIVSVDDARLQALDLTEAGVIARSILLRDQEMLRAHDLSPNVDCIHSTARDLRGGPVCTDVYSWHVDSADAEADTWLCTYLGATSEGLRNDQAVRRVDVPGTHSELLALYGGEDDNGFREFLTENFYDLHYVPTAGARPFSFGIGNLWRIATAYPGSPVPPCIHRAPETLPGQPPRLLLIS
jgi:hypothetical protein